MRNTGFLWIIIGIMVVLDFYVFQAVKTISSGATPRVRTIIYGAYWTISACTVLLLILLPYINYENWPKAVRTYLFATIVGLFFAKLVAVIFFLLDDIRRVIQWASGKLFFRNTEAEGFSSGGISRSVFLSWLGLAAGGGLFGTLIYGFSNKYKYEIRRIKLAFQNLPGAFRGMRLVPAI